MISPGAEPALPPLSPRGVSNRRLSMRVAAILPVDLSLATGGVLSARSTDIGMGGICVATTGMMDPGAVRRVRLQVGRHQLEMSVDARWNSTSSMGAGQLTGFVFEGVDQATEAALWDFIQERGRELACFLRTCEGLGHLSFQEGFDLALATRIRTLNAHEVIYGPSDQEAMGSIFALFRGSVVLSPLHGRKGQAIASVRPGELFGGTIAIAACTPFERAVAVGESRVLEFVGYNIEYLLAEKPRVGLTLLRAASYCAMKRFAQTVDLLLSTRSK